MGRFFIGAPDWSDGQTITADVEKTGFPVTNLLRERLSDRWEADVISDSFYLQVDRSAESVFYAVALINTNASIDATWRIRTADTAAELLTDPNIDTAPLGSCLQLDGSDSASGTDGTYTFTTFSMEGWFKVRNPGAATLYERTGGAINAELRMNAQGRFEWAGTPGDVGLCTSTTIAEANTWYHLSGTYDAGTDVATLIVNGVQEDSASSVTSHAAGTTIALGPSGGTGFSYTANQLRLWDKARIASEVLADANDPLVGTETDLEGLWHLDEETGTSAANSVAGKTALTLAGSPDTPQWSWPLRFWSAADSGERDDRNSRYVESLGANATHLRIDIFDTENPDGAFRAGRLVVASGTPFIGRNIGYGSDYVAVEDRSRFGVSARGRVTVSRGAVARRLRVQFATEYQSQVDNLLRIFEARGGTQDVLIMRDPDSDSRISQGLMVGLLLPRIRVTQDAFSWYRGSFEVVER